MNRAFANEYRPRPCTRRVAGTFRIRRRSRARLPPDMAKLAAICAERAGPRFKTAHAVIELARTLSPLDAAVFLLQPMRVASLRAVLRMRGKTPAAQLFAR